MQLTFATRPSVLARWQTTHVIHELQLAWPELSCDQLVISTRGDHILDRSLPDIGGKGVFTYELEQALREGRVQAAVHSFKDLPTENAPGLAIGAVLKRDDVHDVLVCAAGNELDDLPSGSVIGTSSLRRKAQLLAYRPDLQVKDIRGNVDTRLRKLDEGQYDAIVLAAAGLTRLGLQARITQFLPFEIMLPAPGQGALAVQCNADDEATQRCLDSLEVADARQSVSAERAFLAGLGGGCSLPVGALATVSDGVVNLQTVITAPNGSRGLRLHASGSDPLKLGERLAREALEKGARELLA
jgi:hydroxymethylbilane synthase